LPGGKAGTSAPFHFLGKLAHGLLRDDASFATGKGSFRLINGSKDFRTATLSLLPQGKGFLHCVFLAPKPPAIDSLADKRFLVGTELYFHTFKVRTTEPAVKRGFNRQNVRDIIMTL
jgi:hypothetical protein